MKIHGQLKNAILHKRTTATAGLEGQIIYDTASQKPKYFENGWKDFGDSTTSTNYAITTNTVEASGDGFVFTLAQNNGYNSSVDVRFSSSDNNLVFSATNTAVMDVSLAANPIISGNLTVAGNLEVQGTTTKFNTTEVEIEDVRITLNSNFTTGTPSNAIYPGIEVKRGNLPTAQLVWLEVFDRWGVSNSTFDGYEAIPNLNDIITNINNAAASKISKHTISGTDLAAGTKTLTHDFNTLDIVVTCFDLTTGEDVFPEIMRDPANLNVVKITNDIAFDNNIRVIIERK